MTASAENYIINFPEPANETVVTEFVLEASLQINGTLAKELVTGTQHISGTYAIYSQLCFPKGPTTSSTLQFLIHGGGYAREYWNNAPGYSYVDFAAERGYPTFLYDRLGCGLSDHADPLTVVQSPLEVAIAHELVQQLRNGAISNLVVEKVFGVGHSFGSQQLNGITSAYPKDLDAAELTGLVVGGPASSSAVAFAAFNLNIAAILDPARFGTLPSAYLTSNSEAGIQTFFFRAQNFDPALLTLSVATAQTLTIGEFLTLTAGISPAANFTGPVDFTIGEHDMPVCQGNCLLPTNLAAGTKALLYPAASNGSSYYVAPDTGHEINYHYSATGAYEHIHKFLKKNGL